MGAAAQVIVDTGFQLFAIGTLNNQSWHKPFTAGNLTPPDEVFDIPTSERRPENGVLFIMGCWWVWRHHHAWPHGLAGS